MEVLRRFWVSWGAYTALSRAQSSTGRIGSRLILTSDSLAGARRAACAPTSSCTHASVGHAAAVSLKRHSRRAASSAACVVVLFALLYMCCLAPAPAPKKSGGSKGSGKAKAEAKKTDVPAADDEDDDEQELDAEEEQEEEEITEVKPKAGARKCATRKD